MIRLPDAVQVFERGWLSSNNVLLVDAERAALVDSGYVSHAPQTLALVRHALSRQAGTPRPLDLIVNTHLHSDHCGGNALLQQTYPSCETLVPAGVAEAVRDWDETALTFRATGQQCDRFTFTGTLAPGASLVLGGLDWRVLGAAGHDPHSLMLYCAAEGVLISADALWENGFGVIFPELEGESGFAEQRAALDLIATLDVRVVIPGHGAPFTDIARALDIASSRLDYLRADPARNARNALKVLIVFRLMATRSMSFAALLHMADAARAMRASVEMLAGAQGRETLLRGIVRDLAASGALRIDGETLLAA